MYKKKSFCPLYRKEITCISSNGYIRSGPYVGLNTFELSMMCNQFNDMGVKCNETIETIEYMTHHTLEFNCDEK